MSLPEPSDFACPHCGVQYDKGVHLCKDHDRWTREERDEWRRIARILTPTIQFSPSTAVLQNRFGARNRADMEARR